MIRVALARSEGLSAAAFARLRDGVPLERRVRSDRYHRPEDRRASIVAFALLQHLWRERSAGPLPRVRRGRHGKPGFAEPNGWHFNWSHDTSWCACALAPRPVGIDVQGPVRYDDGLFDRVAAPTEAHLREPLRRLDDLSALWTRKEAVAKRSGLGLGAGFVTLDTVHDPDVVTLTGSDPDLRLSVSAEGLGAGGCSRDQRASPPARRPLVRPRLAAVADAPRSGIRSAAVEYFAPKMTDYYGS